MKPDKNSKEGMSTDQTSTGIVDAALKNNFDEVSAILDRNPDAVNEQNENGLSAAMAAAGRGHLRIVELVSHFPDLNWKLMDKSGRTVLDFAYAHEDVLECVVRRQFGNIDLGKLELV